MSIKSKIRDYFEEQVNYEENHPDSIGNYWECLDLDIDTVKNSIETYRIENDKPKSTTDEKIAEWIVNHKYEISDIVEYRRMFQAYCPSVIDDMILIQSAGIGEIEIQFPSCMEIYIKKNHESLSREMNCYFNSNGMGYACTDVVHAWYVSIDKLTACIKENS